MELKCKECGNQDTFHKEGTCWQKVWEKWRVREVVDSNGHSQDTEWLDTTGDTEFCDDRADDYDWEEILCSECGSHNVIDTEKEKLSKTEQLRQQVR
jgi:hypothetical protein